MLPTRYISLPLLVLASLLAIGCQNQAGIELKFPVKPGTKTYQMRIHSEAKNRLKLVEKAPSPDAVYTIEIIDTENQDSAFMRRTIGRNEGGAVVYDNSDPLQIANPNRDMSLNQKTSMDFSNLITSERNWYQGKTITTKLDKHERGLIISGSIVVEADGVFPDRLQLTIRGNQKARPENSVAGTQNNDFEFTTITNGRVVFNPTGIYLIEASLKSVTHGIAIDPTIKMNQDPFSTDSTMDISVQETAPVK